MNLEQFKHYKLGIPEIDEVHYELFLLINLLRDSIKIKDLKNSILYKESFFKLLREHTVFEEQLMADCSFPYIESHKKSHPEFAAKLNKAKDNKDSNCIFSSDTGAMITTLRDHIDHSDFQYVPYYLKWKESLNA